MKKSRPLFKDKRNYLFGILAVITVVLILFLNHQVKKTVNHERELIEQTLDSYIRDFGYLRNKNDVSSYLNYMSIVLNEKSIKVLSDNYTIKIDTILGEYNIYYKSPFVLRKFKIFEMIYDTNLSCSNENTLDRYFVYNNKKPSIDTLVGNKLYASIKKEFLEINDDKIKFVFNDFNKNQQLEKFAFVFYDNKLKFMCKGSLMGSDMETKIKNKLLKILQSDNYKDIDFARFTVNYRINY